MSTTHIWIWNGSVVTTKVTHYELGHRIEYGINSWGTHDYLDLYQLAVF